MWNLWLTFQITQTAYVSYVTDIFLIYLFMPVVVVPVPNSYRKLDGLWWLNILTLTCMFEISQYDNEQRYQILLWEKFTTDINELYYERFLKLCHCHLIYCITEYNRVLSSLSFRTSITWHISVFIFFCTLLTT